MVTRRLFLAIEFMFGCLLLAGSFWAYRVRRVQATRYTPTVRIDEAAKVYEQRIRATDGLLRQEKFEADGL